MLAAPGDDVDGALAKTGPAAIEYKLDGARLQVHRRGDDVRAFTRSLDDITARVPEVVEAALALPARELVLDGEAIALQARRAPVPVPGHGEPLRHAARRRDAAAHAAVLRRAARRRRGPDRPPGRRARRGPRRAGAGGGPGAARADRRRGRAPHAFLDAALAAGHEGVLVKSLEAPYAAGRRGAGWLKVKPRHTLDLVVLAAEWGHGRRRGWLSNLHLGARDPSGAGFVMLGKTFKGLTDAMLTWQTERLLALEVARDDWTVHVRPELVVEIAFDGVQTSTRYPGGVALRFARVLRHRPDKTAAEADTLDAVLAVHAGGL